MLRLPPNLTSYLKISVIFQAESAQRFVDDAIFEFFKMIPIIEMILF